MGGRNFEEEFGQALFFVSPTPHYVARETKIEPDRRLKLSEDENRRKRWLAKIKREAKLPKPSNCFVCSDHFTAVNYERDLQVGDFFFRLYFVFS